MSFISAHNKKKVLPSAIHYLLYSLEQEDSTQNIWVYEAKLSVSMLPHDCTTPRNVIKSI